MKAGVIPKLEAKWWRDNRAKTLKSSGLGDALVKYEKALAEFTKAAKKPLFATTEVAYKKVIGILDADVTKCVNDGIKACGSLHKETKDALIKYKDKVIPETKRAIAGEFKDCEKEYAVQVRDMVKAFKNVREELDTASKLIIQNYKVLTGFEENLTNYLAGSSRWSDNEAQTKAMEANKHAQTVKDTVSDVVEKVTKTCKEEVKPFNEDMFVDEALEEFKKHSEDYRDRQENLEQKWGLTEDLVVTICKDLFGRVLLRATGQEKLEDDFLLALDKLLIKVRPDVEKVDDICEDLGKRGTAGLKKQMQLAGVVTKEINIGKALKKLEEGGTESEDRETKKQELLQQKKKVLEDKRDAAVEIRDFYTEMGKDADKGEKLVEATYDLIDKRPKAPRGIDELDSKYQKRYNLFSVFRQKLLKARTVVKKAKEEAEGRIKVINEKVFGKK